MAQSNVNNPELSKQKILDHIVDVNDKSVSIISHCYDAGSSLIHDGAVVRIVSGLDTAVAVAEGELLSADTDVTIAQASMSSYKFGDKVVYSSEAYEDSMNSLHDYIAKDMLKSHRNASDLMVVNAISASTSIVESQNADLASLGLDDVLSAIGVLRWNRCLLGLSGIQYFASADCRGSA